MPSSPADPIQGGPISRSTFAALLETLARRQGIDVEKLHDAHNATVLLRLNAVAEDSGTQVSILRPGFRRMLGMTP
jgi:hypothetical protein